MPHIILTLALLLLATISHLTQAQAQVTTTSEPKILTDTTALQAPTNTHSRTSEPRTNINTHTTTSDPHPTTTATLTVPFYINSADASDFGPVTSQSASLIGIGNGTTTLSLFPANFNSLRDTFFTTLLTGPNIYWKALHANPFLVDYPIVITQNCGTQSAASMVFCEESSSIEGFQYDVVNTYAGGQIQSVAVLVTGRVEEVAAAAATKGGGMATSTAAPVSSGGTTMGAFISVGMGQRVGFLAAVWMIAVAFF
ncbi:uncharacterized protein RCC_06066 [Ramularia collo-cygni]|uniref:Uncharacterized protein n=1 Tax=Ramularia collo-cygni TaxID=112498 RepID=A0A2D3VEM0_9PEZI|nr:uncharacterized protein RCC_06066 [Ramularia collo-cygni]CZT20209.1 uncharacterized protein RCC_06066 [Ramularia collo-cygni]